MSTPSAKFGGGVPGTVSGPVSKASSPVRKGNSSGGTTPSRGGIAGSRKSLISTMSVAQMSMRPQTVRDEKKSHDIVGVHVAYKHAFGSNALPVDGLQAYLPASSDKDLSCNLVYRVGKHLVIANSETSHEMFLNRPSNVTDVKHFAISSNLKYISVCETTRVSDDVDITTAQVTVYSLFTYNVVATISQSSSAEFSMSTFCNDPKYLITFTDEYDRTVAVWQWEKAKQMCQLVLEHPVRRIRASASTNGITMSASGSNYFKSFFLPPGISEIKVVDYFCGPNKSKERCNFIDHLWLPSSGDLVHKLVALAGFENLIPTTAAEVVKMQHQELFVFTGMDTPGGATVDKPSVALELKQDISMRVEGAKGIYATAITATAHGFVLTGPGGFMTFFELSDDPKEGFIEVRRMHFEDIPIIASAMMADDHAIGLLLSDNRMMKIQLGDDQSLLAVIKNPYPTNEVAAAEKACGGKNRAVPIHSGFHHHAIIGADIAMTRPLMVSISADSTCRVWNFETMCCELLMHFPADEPLAVAVHPDGFSCLIAFKDRVRLYNILADKLVLFRETIMKNASDVKFSHGGHMWAAASSINISVFDTRTFQSIATLQGHTMTVKRVVWAPDDLMLFSAGMEGNVYGWPINQEGRLEIVNAQGRSSAILSLAVDSSVGTFPKADGSIEEEGGDDGKADKAGAAPAAADASLFSPHPPKSVIVSMLDGNMKLPEYSLDASRKSSGEVNFLFGNEVAVTCVCLSHDRKNLYAGTSKGTVRVYAWPPVGAAAGGVYVEAQVHSSPVVALRETAVHNTLISAAEDGSIFVIDIRKVFLEGAHDADTNDAFSGGPKHTYNSDVVMISQENLDEHVQAMVNMQKALVETNHNHVTQAAKKQVEFKDEMTKLVTINESTIQAERAKLETTRSELDKRCKDLQATLEHKETENAKIKVEIENRYEHKLADQMDRYDRMSEEMELLRQKCEGLILSEREMMTKQLNELKNEAKFREKKLRTEHRRVTEDRISDESAFKEILGQQEEEYEDELKMLIGAAESELTSERETIVKLRTLVQTKNTKLDQLKKKLLELSTASRARLALLNNEKKDRQKLMEIIDHYKLNLREREDALAEKENVILELRNKTRTLENFRFVLDHRLQQLGAERGPIAAHIEGLERHITTMYEELVEEFDFKKESAKSLDQKQQKLTVLSQEILRSKNEAMKTEQYIANFKRELGNIIVSNAMGKELEEAVRLLYRKYVRGEKDAEEQGSFKVGGIVKEKIDKLFNEDGSDDDGDEGGGGKKGGAGRMNKSLAVQVEEALVETAKEAERQKDFVKKEAATLKNRLMVAQREALRMSRNRLTENSNLLYQCNDLRRGLKAMERKNEQAQLQLDEKDNTIARLKSTILPYSGRQPNLREMSTVSENSPASTDNYTEGVVIARNKLHEMSDRTDLSPAVIAPPKMIAPEQVYKPTPHIVHNAFGKSHSTGMLHNKAAAVYTNAARPTVDDDLHSLHGQSAIPADLNNKSKGYDSPTELDKRPTSVGPAAIAQQQVKRLKVHINALMSQLDESYREKEMQRLEIDRMRNLVMKMTLEKGSAEAASARLSRQNMNSQQKYLAATTGPAQFAMDDDVASSSMTSADFSGFPTREEEARLTLGPVPGVRLGGAPKAKGLRVKKSSLMKGGSAAGLKEAASKGIQLPPVHLQENSLSLE